LARRQEVIKNKKKEFGSSSSEEKESVPVHPKLKKATESKSPTTPKINFYKEDDLDNVNLSPLKGSKSPKQSNNVPVSARLRPDQTDKKSIRERYEV